MATILERRTEIHSLLKSAGIEAASLETDLLLKAATGLTTAALFVSLHRLLSNAEDSLLRTAIARRLDREPLAYILGSTEFFGLEFFVDSRVLIPRPETELAVELAIEAAKSVACSGKQPVVADVGTGSGCIALSIASQVPSARIYACDLSASALEIAEINTRKHQAQDRIMLCLGDLTTSLPEKVHIVVSNLPYIPSHELPSLAPELAFEPREALDGGRQGYQVIARLIELAPAKLVDEGTIIIEVGAGQADTVAKRARTIIGGCTTEIHRDLGGIERVVVVKLNPDMPSADARSVV